VPLVSSLRVTAQGWKRLTTLESVFICVICVPILSV
jgi:hypothetical protein